MSRIAPIGRRYQAHCSGALWLPDEGAVLVADAHLGFGWAQRRRGELGPVVDGGARDALASLLDELAPRRLIFLGDTVHAPNPGEEERALIESTLSSLGRAAKITVVTGNHDRAFRRDFGHLGFDIVRELTVGGLRALHGDRLPKRWKGTLALGHLHPSLTLREPSGARRPYRVFLETPRVLVLPAFSPFASGSNLRRFLPEEWCVLLGPHPVGVVAVTGSTAARLESIRL